MQKTMATAGRSLPGWRRGTQPLGRGPPQGSLRPAGHRYHQPPPAQCPIPQLRAGARTGPCPSPQATAALGSADRGGRTPRGGTPPPREPSPWSRPGAAPRAARSRRHHHRCRAALRPRSRPAPSRPAPPPCRSPAHAPRLLPPSGPAWSVESEVGSGGDEEGVTRVAPAGWRAKRRGVVQARQRAAAGARPGRARGSEGL